MPIRVLIADDHSVVRQGLRAFLEGDRGLELVGEARDGAEALRMAHRLRPDVILMDLLMPGIMRRASAPSLASPTSSWTG